MREYCIITESTCDLPPQLAKELELTVFPMSFTVGDKEYRNYLDGRELQSKTFYDLLAAGEIARTAQVTASQFEELFEEKVKQGLDVLCISFSSALSGTCESAIGAAKTVSEKYPEAKVMTVDSLAASGGQGLLVWQAAQKKKEGMGIEELASYVEQTRLTLRHWFTVHNLVYLKRGGRISSMTALFGGMLDVKPILHVDEKGALASIGKTRGRENSLRNMADRLAETCASGPQTIIINHGDCLADAQKLEAMVRERIEVKTSYIADIGPVIGAHVGPGVLALFHFGTSRKPDGAQA